MTHINCMSYCHIATGSPELIHCTRIMSEHHTDMYTQSQRTLKFGCAWFIISNKHLELRNVYLFSISVSFEDLKRLPEEAL